MSLSKIGKTSALNNAINGLLHNKGTLKDVNSALLSFGSVNNAASALASVSIGKGLKDAELTAMLQSAYGGTVSASNAAAKQMETALSSTANAAPKAEAAVSGISGAFLTAKTAAAGLFSVVKSLLPILAPIGVILGGKFLFNQLDDAFTLSKKMADKHYEDSVNKYKATKSDVDEMNSEYESNQERIYELNAKENPTLAEQHELESLRNQNNILSQRKTAKESMLELQQKRKTQDTATSLQHKAASKLNYDNPAGPEEIDVDEIDIANDNLNELEDYYERRNKLIKENADLASAGKADTKTFKNNEKDISKLDKWIDSTKNDVTDKIDTINKKSEDLYNEDGSIDDQYKDLESRIKNLNNRYMGITDTDTKAENAIKNILAKSDFDGVEDKLLKAGKSGGRSSIEKILNGNKKLSDALNEVGIDSDDFIDQIMSQANPAAKRLEGIKENLDDIFGDKGSIHDFFSGKTNEELENFWDYYTGNGYDAKKYDWNLNTVKSNFDAAQDAAKEINPISTPFSSLFKNSAEDTATDLDTITDNFQTDMSNIKSSMDSIKSGTFQNSDITDLIQQFPELATETDNLQQGLQNLAFDKASTAIGKIRDSVKDVTDPKELAAANKYIQSIMDTMDLSDFDVSNSKHTKDTIISNLKGDSIGPIKSASLINQLFSEYGDDKVAMQAIMKLSLDPSMADADWETWKSKIEDTKVQIQLDTSAKNLDNLSKELTRLQTDASDQQTRLNNKSAYNMKATASDYNNLIENGDKQIENLNKQIQEYQTSIDTLRKSKGLSPLSDEDNEQIKQYQDQIQAANMSIENMKASQADWRKTAFNLPVTDMQNTVTALTSAISEMQTETGLTSDTMDSLRTQFSDLKDAHVDNVFDRTAKGLKINTACK